MKVFGSVIFTAFMALGLFVSFSGGLFNLGLFFTALFAFSFYRMVRRKKRVEGVSMRGSR